MRIGFVPAARLLSETEPNGEALIAVSLLRALAARGHDVVAYCERADLEIEGVEIRQVSARAPTAALSRIVFARRIARDAARERFDVLHSLFPMNTVDGHTGATGAPLVCGPLNVPWPRTVAPARLRGRAATRIFDPMERRMHQHTLERAARLLVVGRSARIALAPHLRDRCVDVPFGVSVERFAPRPMPDEPVILFLAALQERKGIDVLLRAMPAVLRRVPRARLIVAGGDPDGSRARLERDAPPGVTFAGPVDPSRTPEMFAACSVFCQPSLGEPFGMTVVEAMASARPVVATAAGGIPDAIVEGKGGLLVPAGDVPLLADALVKILEHSEDARRMGAFNRARAEEHYAIDAVADRIEQVYRDVTKEGARASAS